MFMNDEKSFEPGLAPRIPVDRPGSFSLPAGYRRPVDDLARARQQVEDQVVGRSPRGPTEGDDREPYDAERVLKKAGEDIATKEALEQLLAPGLVAQRLLIAQLTLFYFRLANGTRVFDAPRERVELRANCLAMIDANMTFSTLDVEEAAKWRAAVAEDLESFFALIENATKQMELAKVLISGSA
jgi:hypothetical protein